VGVMGWQLCVAHSYQVPIRERFSFRPVETRIRLFVLKTLLVQGVARLE